MTTSMIHQCFQCILEWGGGEVFYHTKTFSNYILKQRECLRTQFFEHGYKYFQIATENFFEIDWIDLLEEEGNLGSKFLP